MFALILYIQRIISTFGYFVVSYILGLYLLHLIVQFFTPIGVPDIDLDGEEIDMDLPITRFLKFNQ